MAAKETGTLATAGTEWRLDPEHTLVEFSAKHMMITTVKGRFARVEGTLLVDEGSPDASAVEVVIDAGSIDTQVEPRDQHLRSADFLDVENHPVIRFRSARVEGAVAEPGDGFEVIGDLTIRGVTREVVLKAVFRGRGTDPWGGERASFSAATSIDRRDFGLTWNMALEAGGVLVSNKVAISIEAQAIRQIED